jgi:V/A-type H+-transporting ATPase subunit I
MAIIDKILPFKGIDFSRLETRTVSFRVGDVPAEKLLSLKAVLDKELGIYNVIQPAGSKTALLMFQKTGKSVDQMLQASGMMPIEIPANTTTPAQSRRALEKAYSDSGSRLKDIRAELNAMANEYLGKVRSLIYSLGIESERAEIASGFGFSKSMAVFEGWVVAGDVKKVSGVVEKFGERASMSEVPFSHHEAPPVVLDNPKIAGPFEFITKSYSLPNYYELDPTLIYMIGIPLLLGMIVGDVLYGVSTILLSLWLMKKFKDSYIMSNVSKIWFYTGFTSIMFGLVFDEWGGFSNKEILGLLHEWGLPVPAGGLYTGLGRLENLSLLIGLTIIVGLIHLAFGFILGAMNEWNHSKKHAAAKIAWIGIEIGGTVAVCAMVLNLIPSGYGMAGLALLAVSTIIIAITEGIVGILEIPGLMGNALSYARIAAIGVVGVVLAGIINQFFAPKPNMGLFLILAIPLFFIFHFVNLFIAIFEALIQGGRLNLIEFRSKFLKGGGKEFVPFALRSAGK